MSDPLLLLLEKDRIVDVINQLFIATDKRDWPALRRCFAEAVLFDMTSLTGGAPSRLTPEQIAVEWEERLRPIEVIHHQAGNYRVDVRGDRSTAFCYAIASHYRRTRSGRNSRTFVGSYDFHLLRLDGRWQIDSVRFNLKYVDGNANLEREE
jgi:SnoaL-like protein